MILLNIQRVCEASFIVSQKFLGIPQNSRDAFELHKNENMQVMSKSVILALLIYTFSYFLSAKFYKSREF